MGVKLGISHYGRMVVDRMLTTGEGLVNMVRKLRIQ